MGKPGQGGDAPGLDVAIGRDAVVGNAIPGRKAQDVGAGREELKLAPDGREPLIVAGDMQHRLLELGIGRQPARDGREQEGVIALRHARGNNGALAARESVQRPRWASFPDCALALSSMSSLTAMEATTLPTKTPSPQPSPGREKR